MHGQGTYIQKDIFTGQMVNGQMEQGTLKMKNGD